MNIQFTLLDQSTTKKKILIIDDDKDILNFFTRQLSKSGFEPTIANSGFEALKHIGQTKFDLIITDIQMPEIDGFQLVAYIKVNTLNNDTPIFIQSAHLEDSNLKKLVKIGVIDSIPKGTPISNIITKIEKKFFPPIFKHELHKEIIDTLKVSINEIILHFFDSKMEIEELSEGIRYTKSGLYYGSIPLFGNIVFGSIAILGDNNFFESIAKRIFGKSSVNNIHPSKLTGVISETINLIAGSFKRNLLTINMPLVIGLPESGITSDKKLHQKIAGTSTCLEIKSPNSQCQVEICLGDPKLLVRDS